MPRAERLPAREIAEVRALIRLLSWTWNKYRGIYEFLVKTTFANDEIIHRH
jgi:hypothetical protein